LQVSNVIYGSFKLQNLKDPRFNKERGERGNKKERKKERKRPYRHTENPMMRSPVLLKRYQRDKQMTSGKVTNGDWSVPHEWPKDK